MVPSQTELVPLARLRNLDLFLQGISVPLACLCDLNPLQGRLNTNADEPCKGD